jgi:hypothetical protein
MLCRFDLYTATDVSKEKNAFIFEVKHFKKFEDSLTLKM